MSTTASYRPSPIKRSRRTLAQMVRLRTDIYLILEEAQPATVRQTYYLAVSAGLIDKTEQAYKGLCSLLADMRREGIIPYGWLVDNTRLMRKPRTHGSLRRCLENTANSYRRAVWDDQSAYVEIWCEKDALSGVLYDVTSMYDVPLMVTRGFSSLTFLHSAAEAIEAQGKPAYLYYFGDHDPSGVCIDPTTESRLREFAPTADITFERVAVTVDQIAEFKLQTRPTKKTDSRGKNFVGESVEVDAIPPAELRKIAAHCIAQHLDIDVVERTETVQEAERETLRQILRGLD